MLTMFYFQSVNTSDSTSFKQRRYGEAERAEQKQEKVEKLARSTLALKHNEAQRSSLYHIDNNHLTSAKSPRAPPRSGAQCTQYIIILQVAILATKWTPTILVFRWKVTVKENIWSRNRQWQQRFGSCSQKLGQKPRRWRWRPIFATKPSLVLRASKSQIWWEQHKFKCLVIHGVKNPSQDLQWVEKDLKKPSVKGPPWLRLVNKVI